MRGGTRSPGRVVEGLGGPRWEGILHQLRITPIRNFLCLFLRLLSYLFF
ncbi:MAG: hypothetical protein ACJA1O_003307 [Spirosomataceae bacterium]|jgi:hypothetical protein